ncbi:FMN-dependent alpha-hydroxy acid dehydrogenase [Laetiporus sulphureus 93-53]|uniref:FMN-dependent alpha-hydroxy acid dehydrogenase n=1 Tax=Laetiporus sulphureus 93-53 TaxID=1314785 RepID=A0A165HU23_9APHY|nr:FMN-dependent alpha-hydroxy acid dehydrogenase [Laetiporus sulphureus 93-53]KZT12186.1 FMN-dependent alpha-hydroxy acid dehydrogenase [Laetiporus sulphureus 93-53]
MSSEQKPVTTRSSYQKTIYDSRQPPPLGTVDVDKAERIAREKLRDRQDAYMYVFGSAGTASTHDHNRREFDKWKIIPRMLRNVTSRKLETTLFGVKYPSPLLLAPIGVQGIVHSDGEEASAAAASNVGVPYIMSTASTRSIELVARANGSGPRWYQLYWPVSNDITLSILSRVKKAGFSALVVTLDTMLLGWRPHDIDTAYLPFFHGVGAQVGLTDPVYMAHKGLKPYSEDDKPAWPYVPNHLDELIRNGDKDAQERSMLGNGWISETTPGVFKTWDDLPFLRQHWNGPLVLKGIMCRQDAELAIDNGVDGIVVSNHGGRQVDGSISSLYALHQIMQSPKVKEAQASGKLTILFDSGIRTGSDIIKAVALGAQGVLYGRPYIYALAIGGQIGVESQLRAILADLDITLGLVGYKDLDEIRGKADEILVKD